MKKSGKSGLSFLSRLIAKEQVLILTGCLMLAVISLGIIPRNSAQEPSEQVNELELREELGPAADAYMLAETTRERQAAARRIHSLKTGSRSVSTSNGQVATVLRFLLILTILVLAYRIFLLMRAELRLRKAPGS